MYFVRRGDRIKGPLSQEKLRSLRADGRLRSRDEIADSPDGPWSRLDDCRDAVLGGPDADDAADFDGSGLGGLFGDADALALFGNTAAGDARATTARPTSRAKAASVAAGPDGQGGLTAIVNPDGLLRRPNLFWGAILGTAAASGLAALALAAVLGVFSAERHEQIAHEITAEANATRPAPPPRPQPAAEQPTSGQTPRTAARPVTAPTAGGDGDGIGGGSDAGIVAAGGDVAAGEPAAPPRVVEKSVDPAVDQGAAIKELLEGYYTAADWPARYRLAVPGEPVKRLMRLLYADVDWVAVQWSVARIPEQEELVAAARSRKPVRIDTVLNGNPHHILVVWADGRWRVDWMESLETLWLAK